MYEAIGSMDIKTGKDAKCIPIQKATQFVFDHRAAPVLKVELGESFFAETEDAYGGLIRTADRLPIPEHVPGIGTQGPWANPVAGPVYVEGVEKGDVLAVTVQEIVVDQQGVTCFEPGLGPLRDSKRWSECAGPYTYIIRHLRGPSGTTRDGKGIFNNKVVWDLKPFIGTIGVARELEIDSSLSTRGPWGGNMDCRDVKEGSTLYVNCYHKGGLLFVGDVHASQGDTEFYGVADETRAQLLLRCDVIKRKQIPNPRIEKKDSIIALCTSRPVENAVTTAMLDLMEWMVCEYGIEQKEAYMHLGINPDLRIHVYQMCPPAYTVGAEIPKKYLVP